MKDLISILIVNYKTADLLRDCIESISKQNTDIEVVIIDNNSGDYDRDVLKSLLRNFGFLRIIFNRDNLGFSKANNQAIAISHGDYILFLNPDTFLFPSCLEGLLSFLRTTQGVGGVIPKLWMDREKTFLLPPSYLPSLWEKVQIQIFMSSYSLFSFYQKNWLKKALSFWSADTPLEVEAISGAFFMTKRSILDAVGPFDERFPLYFEDSDLCRRIRNGRLKLYYYPYAEAVHYYNQSAKSSAESIRNFITSEKLYLEKYYHPCILKLVLQINNLPKAAIESSFKEWSFSRPIKTVPNDYLLFSPLATMLPCVGHRLTTEHFIFNKSFIEKLANGVYYAMLLTQYGKIYDKLRMKK